MCSHRWFSSDPLPVFSEKPSWAVLAWIGYSIFDVVHPAFLLPTTASPHLPEIWPTSELNSCLGPQCISQYSSQCWSVHGDRTRTSHFWSFSLRPTLPNGNISWRRSTAVCLNVSLSLSLSLSRSHTHTHTQAKKELMRLSVDTAQFSAA